MKTIYYYYVLFLLALVSLQGLTANNTKKENPFINEDLTLHNVEQAILYYEIYSPNIVLAQCILETGHLKSNLCKNYNNLFGLYNSRIHDFYKFNHWSESVIAYKKYIQNRYKPPQDYYEFLNELGYAEDPEYINKLKRLNK